MEKADLERENRESVSEDEVLRCVRKSMIDSVDMIIEGISHFRSG